MSTSILTSPFARLALRTLGMAPLDREFRITGSMENLERILLVDSGDFSDIVFFLPVISEIRRLWPGIEIHMMVLDRWADMLRREAGLAGLIVYREEQLKVRSSSYFRLLKEIRNRSFDAAILMGEELDPPRDLVAYVSQAPLRIGVFHEEREDLLNCMVRWSGQGRYKNELALELTRIFGLGFDPSTWRFKPREEERRGAEQMIHFRKPVKEQLLIGVDLSHGKSRRRFASENLSYLIDHLIEKLGGKVMLMNIDEGQEKELLEFRRRLRSEALDMPRQNLRETVALLASCSLIVSGNTEFFHMAVAAGVPCIGLFSEADGQRWEPRDRTHAIVLRGKQGESVALSEIDSAVDRVLHATPA